MFGVLECGPHKTFDRDHKAGTANIVKALDGDQAHSWEAGTVGAAIIASTMVPYS